MAKPLQNKKGQKNWGTREKSSPFIRKKTAFFSGTTNFFGPSYFEAALGKIGFRLPICLELNNRASWGLDVVIYLRLLSLT